MTAMLLLYAQDGAAAVAAVAAVALVLVGHRLAAYAGIVAVLLVAHAALSSVVVVGHLGPVGPDHAVVDELVRLRSPVATGVLTFVTTVGDTVGMVVLASCVGALLLWRRRTRDAVVMICAVGGAGLLIVAVKDAVGRPRPPEALRLTVESTQSFPSGHSLSSIVVLGMTASIVLRLWPRLGKPGVAVAFVATLGIGFSRVYLGVHWPTDVLDGWLLGGVWLALCLATLSELDCCERRRRPEGLLPEPALPARPPTRPAWLVHCRFR